MDVAQSTRQADGWDVADEAVHRTGWLVDEVLTAPRTPALVARYFDPDAGFAGTTFDLLEPAGGAELGPSDLVAAALLDVPLTAGAVRHLLSPELASGLGRLLRSIPVDADLWSARPAVLDNARQAHELLQEVDGIGPVRAAKLLARKRPRLVPVLDHAAALLLELAPGREWATLRAILLDTGRRERVEGLRPSWLDDRIPLLRLLDVAVWAAASGGRRERTGGRAGDL